MTKVEIPTEDMLETETIEVNEPVVLTEAMKNKGKTTCKAGIRINNTKFYCVSFDED